MADKLTTQIAVSAVSFKQVVALTGLMLGASAAIAAILTVFLVVK